MKEIDKQRAYFKQQAADVLEYMDMEGEEWKLDKKKEELLVAEELYIKAVQILELCNTIAETMKEDDEDPITAQIILESSFIIPPKIIGAIGSPYILQMENASLIRYHAIQLKNQCFALEHIMGYDSNYVSLLREEINLLRQYFHQWVSYFEKDDFEDEWGLFL